MQKVFNTYGEGAFRFEIVEICKKEKDEISNREIYWCGFYKADDRSYGYNIRPAGYVATASLETREKIRIANTRKKHSEETKSKLRAANVGKKLSEETRRQIGLSNKGKTVKQESRDLIAKGLAGNKNGFGKPASEERKVKISKANMGNQYNKGVKRSVEARANMSKAQKGSKKSGWSAKTRLEFERRAYSHSAETKDKISKASKKMWDSGIRDAVSDETKEKIRRANLGKKASAATKEKMSKSHKQVEHTAEWNDKVRKALTGKKLSPEHAAKCALVNIGRVATAEAKENMRKAQILRNDRVRKEKLVALNAKLLHEISDAERRIVIKQISAIHTKMGVK